MRHHAYILFVPAAVGVDGVDRGLDRVSVPRAAAVGLCVDDAEITLYAVTCYIARLASKNRAAAVQHLYFYDMRKFMDLHRFSEICKMFHNFLQILWICTNYHFFDFHR
jgi:hypothetical protein